MYLFVQVRILGDDGSGRVSDIISAIDFVIQQRNLKASVPSVASMSLGGPCDGDCSTDSLVLAVDKMSQNNIVVSVASGKIVFFFVFVLLFLFFILLYYYLSVLLLFVRP